MNHVHVIVQAPAWHFCRVCGRVWDAEWEGAVYMCAGELADEIAAYAPKDTP